ncbi:hypothetical protein D9M72_454670 [compost metagenome]
MPEARFRLSRLVKAISVIDRNRKPRPRPRKRIAAIMSAAPLSLVEPDSIHMATVIIKIPKGTVANGGSRRTCMRKAAKSKAPTKRVPLGRSSRPASVGVKARTETAKDGIRNALPNSAAPATKLTMKAKAKSSDLNTVKSRRPVPLRSTCCPRNKNSEATPTTESQRMRGCSNQSQRLPWLKT